MRRDRSVRTGPELFLLERAFEDCLERIMFIERRFERALMIGCPDPGWVERLGSIVSIVDARDPGPLFSAALGAAPIVEDHWEPAPGAFDLALAIGTLDTVNELPLALRLIRHAMRPDALFIGAISGGDTLPNLRNAMRAADAAGGVAAPHVHPRIEPSALAPLLEAAGFIRPVVDVDRVNASYRSLARLVRDLRAMGATNILNARPGTLTRVQYEAAAKSFAEAGDGRRTFETFELLHFAAWTGQEG